MIRSRTRTLVAKEVRALAPFWIGGLGVLLISLMAHGQLRAVAIFAYVLSAAALGALSVGHEYNDRMLPSLLAQPIRRRTAYAIKQVVLAGMLVTLAAAVIPAIFATPARALPVVPWAALLLPLLGGLFLAPHLTMVCRGAIPGMVFTLGIPGALLTLGGLLGMLRHDFSRDGVNEFQFVFMFWSMVAQCAISAIMSWRMFDQLEAIDARGRDIQLPSWLTSWRSSSTRPMRARQPVWLLVGKELRLQPMAFAVTGLYLLGWLGARMLRFTYPDIVPVFFVLSVFYAGLIALLVGAIASAEERQLGTFEWQALLPIALRTQWLVKAAVALGLTLVLGWALPLLLIKFGFGILPAAWRLVPFTEPAFGGGLLLVTACGLYVSSTATSGLRAFLVSLPGLYCAAMFVGLLFERIGPSLFTATRSLTGSTAAVLTHRLDQVSPLVAGGLVGVMLLRFGLANHRSADRSALRITRQVTWITASLAFGVVLVAVLTAL